MSSHTRRYLLGLVLVLAGVVLLALAGCGGGGIGSWFDGLLGGGAEPTVKGGADGGISGARDQFAHLLGQLQWLFIGLGIAAVVASIWIPIISTRHAVGSIVLGVGIALIKPFVIALYWPTVICLGLAGIAAVWPYGLAAYNWARARITGKPIDPAKLTTGLATLQTLWKPRGAVLGNLGGADSSRNPDGVPPANGGAS